MARIRSIKPEFFTSDDIVTLTPLSRLFYVALWCQADREGRLAWNLNTLKLRCLPCDDTPIADVAKELIDKGLVVVYEVESKLYAHIPSFITHQIINNRETESVIPPPVRDASKRRERGRSGEGKGKEGKGREHLNDASEKWDEFVSIYPKRLGDLGMSKAKVKFTSLLQSGMSSSTILDGVRNYRRYCDNNEVTATRFVKQMTTWLNGEGWNENYLDPGDDGIIHGGEF